MLDNVGSTIKWSKYRFYSTDKTRKHVVRREQSSCSKFIKRKLRKVDSHFPNDIKLKTSAAINDVRVTFLIE